MRRTLAALVFSALLPVAQPALAAPQHTVKAGETLSEIAERYGVPVQRLMQLNDIKQADLVQTGTRLTLPGGSAAAGGGNVTVKPGETLSEIADRYGLSVKRLIELNGIQDPDLVQTGTRLVVPGATSASNTAAAKTSPAKPATVNKNAREHVVQPGETLSQIADRYGVPMSQLVSLNDLKEPDKVQAGSRLALRESAPRAAAPKPATAKPTKPVAARPAAPKPEAPAPAAAKPQPAPAPAKVAAATPKPSASGGANWRTYGPLQVDFANWRPLGGSDVAPALNGAGQPIFVSVNCSAQKINATGEGGAWKTWEPPQTDFEQALVRDACKAIAAQAAQRNGQG